MADNPLRVLRFYSSRPRVRAWSRVARRVAEEIELHHVRRLTWQPVNALGFVAQDPEDTGRYQILVTPLRNKKPKRLTWPLDNYVMIRRYVAFISWLQREIGYPLDLIHVHSYVEGRALPEVTRRLGVPFVLTEHFPFLLSSAWHHSATRAGRRVARQVYTSARFVMPVSEWLRDELVSNGMTARFEVIPPPIDNVTFSYRSSQRKDGSCRVITAGRLEPVKGLDILLRAFAVAARSNPQLQLVVAGEGSKREELQTLAHRLGLDGRVEWLGRLEPERLALEYNRSDLFASSTWMETFGKAVVEAIMSGLPVVATKTGALSSIVPRYGGTLVEPGSVDGIADALLRIAAGLPESEAEARSRAEKAEQEYGVEAVAERLAQCYRKARSG